MPAGIFEGCPCGADGHVVLDPVEAEQLRALIEVTPPMVAEHGGKRVIVPPIAVVLHGGMPEEA